MKRLFSLLTVAGAAAGAVWYAHQQGEEQSTPAQGQWTGRPKLKAVPDPARPAAAPSRAQPKPTGSPSSDDLTEIKGIGPKYSQQLNELGVKSFAALAQADLGELSNHFDARAKVDSWIAQARELSTG